MRVAAHHPRHVQGGGALARRRKGRVVERVERGVCAPHTRIYVSTRQEGTLYDKLRLLLSDKGATSERAPALNRAALNGT